MTILLRNDIAQFDDRAARRSRFATPVQRDDRAWRRPRGARAARLDRAGWTGRNLILDEALGRDAPESLPLANFNDSELR